MIDVFMDGWVNGVGEDPVRKEHDDLLVHFTDVIFKMSQDINEYQSSDSFSGDPILIKIKFGDRLEDAEAIFNRLKGIRELNGYDDA